MTAGTWVHRSHKLKVGRICHRGLHSRDCHLPVFEWLSECLECRSGKLRQFIEEQDPAGGKRDLPRLRSPPASRQCLDRYRVVGCTERPDLYKRLFLRQKSAHTVDLRDLDALLHVHPRHDRRHSPRKHGLSGPRRPHDQKVVLSGGCHLRRPPKERLSR